MDMKLWRYGSPAGQVEILDTGGGPGREFDRQLALCRSFTLPADRVLLGPERLGREIFLKVLDWQGRETALEPWTARAFSAFLWDAGYDLKKSVFLWDGYTRFPIQKRDPDWVGHVLDVEKLLSL
jgi:hypothetical protein